MSLYISSLNTGSNGNCFYIGNDTEAILIDAGISCRETEKRMKRLGLSMEKVKAIFVSHEHSDHISGIPVLARKYSLPVYISDHTYRESRLSIQPSLVRKFQTAQFIPVGSLSIKTFRKSHDASDPHSFVITCNGVNVGVLTDIGWCCSEVVHHFRQCNAVFLESNYCEEMLMNGPYPYHLKKRIQGDRGHLSNHQALELFRNFRSDTLSHLILSHLSKNNNSPVLVEQLFAPYAGTTKIVVASRYKETELMQIGVQVATYPTYSAQLSLF